MYSRRLKLFLFLFLLWTEAIWAQRLQIEVNAPTQEAVYAVYGRYHEGDFWLFEQKIDLPPVIKSPPAVTMQKKVERSAKVVTRFEFLPKERRQCTKSPRFLAMVGLMSALKERFSEIILSSPPDWDTCQEEVRQTLLGNDSFAKKQVHVETATDNNALRIRFLMVSLSETQVEVQEKAPPVVEANPKLRLFVGSEEISLNDQGLFLAVRGDFSEMTMSIIRGTQRTEQRLRPLVMRVGMSQVMGSPFYNQRVLDKNAATQNIQILPAVALEHQSLLGLGLGLGYGYAREVPGEQNGQRYYTHLNYDHHRLFDFIGIKAQLGVSLASDSAVPFTMNSRFFLTARNSFTSWNMFLDYGFGFERFAATIKKADKKKPGESAVIPEEVVSPALFVGVESYLFNLIHFAPQIYLTPLYVEGLYLSMSHHVEVGYKFSENILGIVTIGNEVHRYPTLQKESRLQIDFMTLSARYGF
jgi:hypothetical protein